MTETLSAKHDLTRIAKLLEYIAITSTPQLSVQKGLLNPMRKRYNQLQRELWTPDLREVE